MNTSQPSICFVIPYFGQWPFWMPFFLASCRANPTVNWLLFSDCGRLADCPPNVRIVDTDYAGYCKRVSEKLGIPFAPENPYKLCDLKPALGFIHEEDLVGYDFWAFGDLDLVFGDFRAYFTAHRLARKDLFSTHARRISGHCCLLRNTKKMREAFFLMRDWRARLADPAHHGLDEGAFSRLFIRRKNWPHAIARLMRLLNPWYRRAEFVEAFTTPDARVPWIGGGFAFPRRWCWRAGILACDGADSRRFPYVHFLYWKGREWKQLTAQAIAGYPQLARESAWDVTAYGFFPAGEGRE